MKAVVLYESLTGNTRKAAGMIGAQLERRGVGATVASVTAVPYQALAEADLVVVGTWTDGLVLFGQRPGRSGRLRKLPYISGKRCAVFVTYAIDAGNVLDKLVALMEDRGAEVLGGLAIRRDDLAGGSTDFVERVLEVVKA
ncbi:MAG TPA: flavodoxin domain-containing protein [Acidimicrobiales bacterium]|nr:flavodoxin domain-containing protein [Acidimicrobiales bacterium]